MSDEVCAAAAAAHMTLAALVGMCSSALFSNYVGLVGTGTHISSLSLLHTLRWFAHRVSGSVHH